MSYSFLTLFQRSLWFIINRSTILFPRCLFSELSSVYDCADSWWKRLCCCTSGSLLWHKHWSCSRARGATPTPCFTSPASHGAGDTSSALPMPQSQSCRTLPAHSTWHSACAHQRVQGAAPRPHLVTPLQGGGRITSWSGRAELPHLIHHAEVYQFLLFFYAKYREQSTHLSFADTTPAQ